MTRAQRHSPPPASRPRRRSRRSCRRARANLRRSWARSRRDSGGGCASPLSASGSDSWWLSCAPYTVLPRGRRRHQRCRGDRRGRPAPAPVPMVAPAFASSGARLPASLPLLLPPAPPCPRLLGRSSRRWVVSRGDSPPVGALALLIGSVALSRGWRGRERGRRRGEAIVLGASRAQTAVVPAFAAEQARAVARAIIRARRVARAAEAAQGRGRSGRCRCYLPTRGGGALHPGRPPHRACSAHSTRPRGRRPQRSAAAAAAAGPGCRGGGGSCSPLPGRLIS
eukprot:COSAG01_NODE_258_length_20077_cov_124.162429_32_plen_282_part_00